MVDKVVLGENPIVFPALTFKLTQFGVKVNINGKKRADFRLAFNLLEGACGAKLPDISVYNVKTGKWDDYFNVNSIIIEPPVGNSYRYMNPPDDAFSNYCVIENFIRLYSSALISMKRIVVQD